MLHKTTILTHLLAFGLITSLTNSTKRKAAIVLQILLSVVSYVNHILPVNIQATAFN